MSKRASGSLTIVDVAEHAGVSIKTVSRVLNHEAGVHESTRELVLRSVKELKYRPKLSARSLAGSRSFLIGLFYYSNSAAYVAPIQQGAVSRCREIGYHLVVESLEAEGRGLEEQVEHVIGALRVDGVILTPPLCDNARIRKALHETGTPVVLISPGKSGGIPSVMMDDEHASMELTNLLLDMGHRRIGFIKGAASQVASTLRYRGFEQALRARGLAVDPQLVRQGEFTFGSGQQCADELLALAVPPTAIFASNDDMAIGVLASAHSRRLSVPADLSVVGFDDSPLAKLVWPALTTVRQPLFEMATAAVDLLLAAARLGEPGTAKVVPQVLAHDLVVRGSMAPPKTLA